MRPFADRRDAGRRLAERLALPADALVLALPRGGVPVAFEVARAGGAELDVLLVRKLGAPGQPELALGAIAADGTRVLNRDLLAQLHIDEAQLEPIAEAERGELQRRAHRYRGERPPPRLAGRRVVLVDDGLATGASMRAAVALARQGRPARLEVAVPVAPVEVAASLRREVDAFHCLATPEPFAAVGRWYRDFDQTGDAEVEALLRDARTERSARPQPPGRGE